MRRGSEGGSGGEVLTFVLSLASCAAPGPDKEASQDVIFGPHCNSSELGSPTQQAEGVRGHSPGVILHLHTSLWDSQSMMGSVVDIGSTV